MSFEVETHAQIRARLLSNWRTAYRNRGWDLDVSRDSDAYAWGDAFAFEIEGLEGRLAQLIKEIFPHTASTAWLEEHGNVIGLARKAATKARLYVDVAGSGSWTTADRLVSLSGAQYAPVEAGSTPGPVLVEATAAGAVGNLVEGDPIAWNPAPSGITASTTVDSVAVVARDAELDADYAQRILSYWRERPGGANRAQGKEWGESRDGVSVAFVYPLLHTTEGPDTPGAGTICVMGPVPTLTGTAGEPLASQTRQVSGAVLDDVHDFIFGEGAYEEGGGEIPFVIDPDDVFVVTVQNVPQDVDVEVTPDGIENEFPFAGPLAFTGGTATQVTVASLPAGLATGRLVAIPSSSVRGGYAFRQVTVSGSGPYMLAFDAVGGPSATGSILPLPSNAFALRAKALSVFDALGPGKGTGRSLRFPAPSAESYPAILYKNSLVAALMGVPGVLDTAPVDGVEAVDVTLVGALNPEKVEPSAKQLITCGVLRILRA